MGYVQVAMIVTKLVVKIMRSLLCFVIFFLYVGTASAQQTYTITGIVTDEKDAPIPGATVFLGDSRKATASDSEGRFTLTQVQPGNYNLVVKMMGFVVLQHAFMLQNKDARFRFKLEEDNIMLNEVNISGMSDADRKGYLALFIQSFLGISKNAAQCKILNTDIVKFKYDKRLRILTAYTNDFLEIDNKALGYRMKFLLSNFNHDSSNGQSTDIGFYGTLYFEELKGTASQLKQWEQARVEAYLGSVPHFFRSAFNNTLTENGFEAYQMLSREALNIYNKKRKPIPLKYYEPLGSLNKFFTAVDSNFRKLDFKALTKDSTDLYVVYKSKGEPADFIEKGNVIQRFFLMPAGQTSILRPLLDSVLVDKSGGLSPTNGTLLMGYWSWGQMSSFLPTDYEIPVGMDPFNIKKSGAAALTAPNK